MTATLTKPRDRNGSAPPAFDLDTAPTVPGRRRMPEIAAGVLVILVFALGALWWQASTTQRTEVLAVRASVERGHVMTVNDLQLVGIDSDDNLAVLRESDAAAIVGRVARTDLAAGALVTRELFSTSSLIGSGEGVVGLSLEAGQFPSLRMATGDVVSVVLTPSASDPRGFDAASPANVLVARATVVEVEAVGVQGRLFVAVQVGEADAARVAAAASANRVRLIQVAES
ncbi:MAG: SAF domain-containing protein [Ilumatobacteraceae bacterium]